MRKEDSFNTIVPMQNDYDESRGDLSDLSDDEMFFNHVVQEDHDLITIDVLLNKALSQVSD